MASTNIKSAATGKILYASGARTVKNCLEEAVSKGINLDYADLRHANLSGANLDDARLRHARFDHANLSGANLSEAILDGGSFHNAALHSACLSLSSARNCRFDGALFGATEIAGAVLDFCRFSTYSAFSLSFIDCASMKGCVFTNAGKITSQMSTPPIVISGLEYPVALMDDHLMINGISDTYAAWSRLIAGSHTSGAKIDNNLLAFIRRNRDLLSNLTQRPSRAASNGPGRQVA